MNIDEDNQLIEELDLSHLSKLITEVPDKFKILSLPQQWSF